MPGIGLAETKNSWHCSCSMPVGRAERATTSVSGDRRVSHAEDAQQVLLELPEDAEVPGPRRLPRLRALQQAARADPPRAPASRCQAGHPIEADVERSVDGAPGAPPRSDVIVLRAFSARGCA